MTTVDRYPTSRWDVFFSYARSDAAAVAPLLRELREAGLRVFVDESNVRGFTSLTGEISTALADSSILLAYYSPVYPTRPSCQWELTRAFLAGQREGDARSRIMLILPQPDAVRIELGELRDARHWPYPTKDPADLPDAIRDRLKTLDGPMATLDRPSDVDSNRFTGRFQDLWRIHTSLTGRTTFASTSGATPTCQLTGLPGIGKTALARHYCAEFAAAFDGEIIWHDTDHLPTSDNPGGLTVIDDARSADTERLRGWLTGRRIDESILIITRHRLELGLDTVELGGLADADAQRLLDTYHHAAVPVPLLEELGGHPQAVHLAGGMALEQGGSEAFTRVRQRWLTRECDEVARFAQRAVTLADGYPADPRDGLDAQLSQLASEARDLLRALCVLPPALRQQQLLVALMREAAPESEYWEGESQLRRHGLYSPRGDGGFDVGPVVVRHWLRYDPDPLRADLIQQIAWKLVAGYGGSAEMIDISPGDAMTAPALTRIEQETAFRLQVELATRISTVPLSENDGILREALSSLKTVLEHARTTLSELAGQRHSGQVQAIAQQVIDAIRPLLSHWHPELLDHESVRPPEVGLVAHERSWSRAAELRSALGEVRNPLTEAHDELASLTGTALRTNTAS